MISAVAPSVSISSNRSDSVDASTSADASPAVHVPVEITRNEQSRLVASSSRSCAAGASGMSSEVSSTIRHPVRNIRPPAGGRPGARRRPTLAGGSTPTIDLGH